MRPTTHDRSPAPEPPSQPSAPLRGPSAACAIFVSHYPDPSFAAHVGAVLDQVAEVIVVDNASGAGSAGVLWEVEHLPGVTLLRWPENRGIGAALNAAADVARARGWRWMVTFDQDSAAPPGFVDELLSVVRSYPTPDDVAVVGPVYVDQGSGMVTSFAPPGMGVAYPVDAILTSGSLVRTDVHDSLGGFDEGLFIDYVDIEYCLRCTAEGYAVLQARRALLGHNLGHSVVRRILGRRFGVTNHAPLRRYYISRNRIAVYRRYARSRPGWVLRDAYSFLRENVKILLYEEDRGRKAIATARGLIHGLRGVTGRYDG